ncbi:hypothetical protein ACFTZB_23695 [Rhodococcus sp. NPDC057014]|uniref:hypothetical protein n=1 Tax=Rhodococcus sp. NPDC057014 TaxID=3346000 RepID=UPI003628222D
MNALTTGIVAGAAGNTMLDAVTYLDMAIRGRPQAPSRRGLSNPLHPPWASSFPGTETPSLRGINDPRTWTTQDWFSDLVPHLVYGATVTTVLRQQDAMAGNRTAPAAERSSTVRSAVIGMASGLRSSTGIAAALLAGATGSAHRIRLIGATAVVGGELVADKNPTIPSRLSPPALTGRLTAGGGGAAALARGDRADTASALIIGTVGALAGSYGGAWWRQWAGARMPDWQAALAEDAVALTMAAVALRRPARS